MARDNINTLREDGRSIVLLITLRPGHHDDDDDEARGVAQ